MERGPSKPPAEAGNLEKAMWNSRRSAGLMSSTAPDHHQLPGVPTSGEQLIATPGSSAAKRWVDANRLW